MSLGWWQGWAHLPNAWTECETFVETDEEGRFRFDGVRRGTVSLDALAPPLYVGRLLTHLSLPTDDLDVVVAADATRVRGKVVDAATGVPVDRGLVAVRSWARDWGPPLRDGTFEVFVPRNADALVVAAPGYARSRVEQAELADGLVVRLERGFAVEGTARDVPGRPVAGVKVFASREVSDWDTVTLTATTDEHGHYRIEGLPRGDPIVFALGAGHCARGPHPWSEEGKEALRVPLSPEGAAKRDFVLAKAAVLRVRVLDHEGRPVRRALAYIQPRGSYFDLWDEAGDLARAETDDRGIAEFRTVLPNAEHDATVLATGHANRSVRVAAIPSGGDLQLDVVLPVPRWFEVQVVEDPGGKPIAGAALTAYIRFPSGTWNGDDRAIHWVTDQEGKAVVGPLGEGPAGVSAEADAYAGNDWPDRCQALAPDGVTTIRLRAAATISGRVESPTPLGGRPVEVRFRRRSTPAMSYASDETWLTALEGVTFRTQSLEGDAYLVKASVRVGDDLYEAEGEASTGTKDLVLRLRATEARAVRLIVLDPDGGPVPLASAVVFPIRDGRREHGLEVGVRAGEGRREVPSDVALVSIEIRDAQSADGRPLPLAGGAFGPFPVRRAPIEIRLAPERAAGGVVRDALGQGVAGVVVRAIPSRAPGSAPEELMGSRPASEARTGPEGRFTLHGIGKHPYDLRFAVPAAYATPDPVALPMREGAQVEVVLQRGLSATVRVVDPDGRPVAGARVALWWWRADVDHEQFCHLDRCSHWFAEEDGTVRFDGLLRGRRYNIRVDPPDTRKDLGEVERDPWQIDDLEFRLPPHRHLGGVVRDAKGEPVGRAGVGWRRTTGGPWHIVNSDAQGRFELADVGVGAVFVGRRETGGSPTLGPEGTRLSLDTPATITFQSAAPHAPVVMRFGGPDIAQTPPADFPILHAPGAPTILANLDPQGTYSAYFGPTPSGEFFHAEGAARRPGGSCRSGSTRGRS